MALFDRLDWSSNTVATTMSGAIVGTGAITPSIAAFTGWPDGSDGPFDILVGGIEIMRVTSRSSGVLTIAAGGRGMFGTSATTHASGVAAIYVCTGNTLDEFNRICSIVGNGTVNLPMIGGGAAAVPSFAALTATGLATDSVTTAKILAANVTTVKIADANVTADKLAAAVAGDGLTGGAGSALAVGAGHGIDVTADAVDVDETELSINLILNLLLTTRGDIIRRGASNPERLALGTAGKLLASDGTDVVYVNPPDHGGDLKQGVWTTAPTGWALMNGQTVTTAQTLYPETWANAPTSWRSGSSLILPDWKGLVPVMLNASDTDFDVMGETGGAKTAAHTHPLDLNGYAKARISTVGELVVTRETSVSSYNATNQFSATGGDGTTNSGANTSAIELGGVTGSTSSSTVQPYATVNWAIRLK